MGRKKAVRRERRVENVLPARRVTEEELRRIAGEISRVLSGMDAAKTAPRAEGTP